jgi:hypothetical protein
MPPAQAVTQEFVHIIISGIGGMLLRLTTIVLAASCQWVASCTHQQLLQGGSSHPGSRSHKRIGAVIILHAQLLHS